MIGRSSPTSSPSSSSSRGASSLSVDETVSGSAAHNGSGGDGIESVRNSNGGNAVWKKPVEGEKEKVPVVMGASSWPALSNSFKKISTQQDCLLKCAAETAITPQSVPCLESASESLNNSSSDLVENNQHFPSSGKNLSTVSSSENQTTTVYGDSTSSNSATITTSNSGPISDQKKTGGVGPHSGPPRPSRPYHHHRAHHYNPRYPPHQRGKESFNHDSNNNHSTNNNNHYSTNKRNQNRFHEFNSNRLKHFHPPFHPPLQGLSNGPHQFLMPRPPPPPPYTPINFPYYNAPLPPPGYIFPYNYVSEHPYVADNSWQFTLPPFMDMNHMIRGVPPSNLRPPLTTQAVTPTINPQPQTSPTNPQPQPQPVSSEPPLSNPQSQPPLVIPPGQFVAASQAELCRILRSQIEYYFSDENLVKDTYLKGQMNEQGWVSVHLIAGFRRVKAMTEDISLILKALELSTRIEVQDDKIRRSSGVAQNAADGSVNSSLPTETMLVTQLDNLVLDGGFRLESLATQSQLSDSLVGHDIDSNSSEHAKEKPSAT
ncbi:la-related protein 1B-like [Aristolochia californica]|uniref:la-related protein 1B-like n=1 Tax=Aristolochia californica TaxID=171875 RepID=UPI0035DA2780